MGYRDKTYTLYGITMSRPLWCAYMGINYDTVVRRMKGGMELEDALTTPLKPTGVHKKYVVDGRLQTMTESASNLKIGLGALRIRVKKAGSIMGAKDNWVGSEGYTKTEELFSSVERMVSGSNDSTLSIHS